jgi:hypothetical protein
MRRAMEKKVDGLVNQDINFKLQEEFQLGAAKFANNPLHLKLRGNGDVKDKLNFIPRMLFFVMGFKDLMQVVRYENPKNELEESVNTHSDEDSYHWEWYLSDLRFINGRFENQSASNAITEVWADESYQVRETIYLFAQHIKNYSDPVARMLMVEVLEITFDKFKAALHPVLKDADLYYQLEYFGKRHQETEENHTTGISENEIAGLIAQLPNDLKEEMLLVINQLFDQMYNMAKNWSEAI